MHGSLSSVTRMITVGATNRNIDAIGRAAAGALLQFNYHEAGLFIRILRELPIQQLELIVAGQAHERFQIATAVNRVPGQ